MVREEISQSLEEISSFSFISSNYTNGEKKHIIRNLQQVIDNHQNRK